MMIKVAFYDNASLDDKNKILNTNKVHQDDDIQYGNINRSLIMLSHHIDIPFEVLERTVERIEFML